MITIPSHYLCAMDAAPPQGARGGQSYRTPASDPGGNRTEERRRRLLKRSAPIVGVSLLAFTGGAVIGASSRTSETAQRFADAWERQDFAAMHAELSTSSQDENPVKEFTDRYVDAQATATAVRVATGEVEDAQVDGEEAVGFDATVDTRAFGQVTGRIEAPLDDEGRIEWSPHLTFPGLVATESLDRTTRVGERAPLLARDGTPLAEGPAEARTSPLGAAALAIAGSVGSPSRKQERELYALGYPPDTPVGISGLELAFNLELTGQPSGQLLAVSDAESAEERILASGDPVRGEPVRTTIDPQIQAAAVGALGDTFGGVAVLDARKGDVLGVAGLAFSEPQPPGSTFKVITATAGLDTGAVKLSDTFPVETSNSLIGREISNAHDSACGGTFTQAFAMSCNTVFAPLGVEVGADPMFETAELFGFNEPPTLATTGALEALAPPSSTYPMPESEVELGESAIGQGRVLATPLQMASVAQTIANKGVRMPTSLVRSQKLRPSEEPVEVTSRETAATMKDLMIEVVRSGTGVAAQVPGVTVAGKTGTAELGPAPLEPGQTLGPGEDPPQKENAWFTAFAPADKPSLAIAAVVFDATGGGGGGAVAAPIAQQVLAAELG
jgi:peptidoglycan glycosyltransferase